MKNMPKLVIALLLIVPVFFAQDLVSIIHGTIKQIDKATKTVVIKTADGTEHTIKVTDDATIHGTKEGFDGLKEGSEVVARCTVEGTEKTADDIGKVAGAGTEKGAKITAYYTEDAGKKIAHFFA